MLSNLGFTTPIARKDHRCTGCLGTIKKGERYVRHTMADDTIWTTKLCVKCDWVSGEMHPDDIWSEGDLKNDHEFFPEGYEIKPINKTEGK